MIGAGEVGDGHSLPPTTPANKSVHTEPRASRILEINAHRRGPLTVVVHQEMPTEREAGRCLWLVRWFVGIIDVAGVCPLSHPPALDFFGFSTRGSGFFAASHMLCRSTSKLHIIRLTEKLMTET